MQPIERACRTFAERWGADAILNGMGGDNVFCSLRSALPVADSLRARRSLRDTWQTVRDVAALAEVNAYAVLRQAIRLTLRGRRPQRSAGAGSFLSAKALKQMDTDLSHPWLEVPPRIAAGRACHVEMLARVQLFVEGFDRWSAPPSISPLLSQPVLEMCLRIPSWRWVAGGRNRAMAREAFEGRLPERILARRSKGGPDTLSIAVCMENLPLLRELLLEGDLAARGLIDRPVVERALTGGSLLQHGRYHDILSLVDAEAWICHWNSVAASSAARTFPRHGSRDQGPPGLPS
jgi:asparagine synthase (glutamine-hydrolysing)